jgi:2'-5' RNA ligase
VFGWLLQALFNLPRRLEGVVSRPRAYHRAAELAGIRAEPFELRVSGVGRFEQRNSGALWAAVEPKPPLAALAAKVERVCQTAGLEPKAPVAALAAKVERICQEVGLEPERRAFHPHVTLARWKGRRSREVADYLERRGGLTSAPFDVTEFTLFESQLSRHGAHYEQVASYPLGAHGCATTSAVDFS